MLQARQKYRIASYIQVLSEERRVKSEESNGSAAMSEQAEQSTAGQAEQAIKEDLNQGGLHRTNNHLDNSVASEKTGEGFDAPPTLERSGTEHRGGAVTSPSLLRSEGDWGSEVEPSLAKEGRGGSKKMGWFEKIKIL